MSGIYGSRQSIDESSQSTRATSYQSLGGEYAATAAPTKRGSAGLFGIIGSKIKSLFQRSARPVGQESTPSAATRLSIVASTPSMRDLIDAHQRSRSDSDAPSPRAKPPQPTSPRPRSDLDGALRVIAEEVQAGSGNPVALSRAESRPEAPPASVLAAPPAIGHAVKEAEMVHKKVKLARKEILGMMHKDSYRRFQGTEAFKTACAEVARPRSTFERVKVALHVTARRADLADATPESVFSDPTLEPILQAFTKYSTLVEHSPENPAFCIASAPRTGLTPEATLKWAKELQTNFTSDGVELQVNISASQRTGLDRAIETLERALHPDADASAAHPEAAPPPAIVPVVPAASPMAASHAQPREAPPLAAAAAVSAQAPAGDFMSKFEADVATIAASGNADSFLRAGEGNTFGKLSADLAKDWVHGMEGAARSFPELMKAMVGDGDSTSAREAATRVPDQWVSLVKGMNDVIDKHTGSNRALADRMKGMLITNLILRGVLPGLTGATTSTKALVQFAFGEGTASVQSKLASQGKTKTEIQQVLNAWNDVQPFRGALQARVDGLELDHAGDFHMVK